MLSASRWDTILETCDSFPPVWEQHPPPLLPTPTPLQPACKLKWVRDNAYSVQAPWLALNILLTLGISGVWNSTGVCYASSTLAYGLRWDYFQSGPLKFCLCLYFCWVWFYLQFLSLPLSPNWIRKTRVQNPTKPKRHFSNSDYCVSPPTGSLLFQQSARVPNATLENEWALLSRSARLPVTPLPVNPVLIRPSIYWICRFKFLSLLHLILKVRFCSPCFTK